MKLCILTHIFPARSETFVREHAVGMAQRGYEVSVLARAPGDGISRSELCEIDRLGVRRIYLGAPGSRANQLVDTLRGVLTSPSTYRMLRNPAPWSRRGLLTALRTARGVVEVRPDIVHVHFGTLAARLQRVAPCIQGLPPLLATWHGYDANAMPLSLGDDIYGELFSSDTQHTVGSRFMRDRLLALGASPDNVSITPMGIDITRFPYIERVPHPSEPLRVLSVGRLDEMKGHAYLIAAIRMLRGRGIPVTLRIVGEGKLRPALQQQIHDEDLADAVALAGALPPAHVAEEMRSAHVFALSAVEASNGRIEAQGVVFAEAQATGLPVVTTEVGGAPESIVDGATGFVCPPKDVAAMADALQYFSENRDRIAQFGERGRRFVEENFSLDKMLDRFIKKYDELLVAQH